MGGCGTCLRAFDVATASVYVKNIHCVLRPRLLHDYRCACGSDRVWHGRRSGLTALCEIIAALAAPSVCGTVVVRSAAVDHSCCDDAFISLPQKHKFQFCIAAWLLACPKSWPSVERLRLRLGAPASAVAAAGGLHAAGANLRFRARAAARGRKRRVRGRGVRGHGRRYRLVARGRGDRLAAGVGLLRAAAGRHRRTQAAAAAVGLAAPAVALALHRLGGLALLPWLLRRRPVPAMALGSSAHIIVSTMQPSEHVVAMQPSEHVVVVVVVAPAVVVSRNSNTHSLGRMQDRARCCADV